MQDVLRQQAEILCNQNKLTECRLKEMENKQKMMSSNLMKLLQDSISWQEDRKDMLNRSKVVNDNLENVLSLLHGTYHDGICVDEDEKTTSQVHRRRYLWF